MKLLAMLESAQIPFEKSANFADFEPKSLLPLELAAPCDVSYITDAKYLDALENSRAGAVLVDSRFRDKIAPVAPRDNVVFTESAHLAFALLSGFWRVRQLKNTTSAKISANATIFPNVFIGENVEIGESCVLMPNVVLCDNVRLGRGVTIHPNATIYANSVIGDGVIIHAGCAIGCDGFGYAHTSDGRHIKIEHFGNVVIEEGVEIGANTTIDRAVFNSTIIKKGAKIDNLVQIGHNCVVGEHALIVSQTGLAGSTTTGRNVVFGGQSGTGGHIHIGDFVQIAGRGAVGKNLPPNTKWGGHPLLELHEWQKMQVKLRKLTRE